jgi:hypothetical protein
VLHLDGDGKCVGWIETEGCKCTAELDHCRGARFKALLAHMAQQPPGAYFLGSSLVQLAKCGLCFRRHQYQAADMVQQWVTAILAVYSPSPSSPLQSLVIHPRSATPPQPVVVAVRPDSPQDPVPTCSATEGVLGGPQCAALSASQGRLDNETLQHLAPQAAFQPILTIGYACIAISEHASFSLSVLSILSPPASALLAALPVLLFLTLPLLLQVVLFLLYLCSCVFAPGF